MNRPSESDTAIRFVTYLHIDHIVSTFSNKTDYRMQKGWNRFDRNALQTNILLAVILAFPSLVASVLGVTHLSPLESVAIGVETLAGEMFITDVIAAEAISAYSHSRFNTNAEQVCKRRHSSIIVRSSKKRCSTITTATATAVVIERTSCITLTLQSSLNYFPRWWTLEKHC